MSELLERAFRESGYLVEVAENGEEGLKAANDFDLIIVDWMMPKLSGVEMIEQLRRLGSRIPVILLTAKDGIEDRVAGLEIGGDDYLVKPFKLEELFARVRVQLRRLRDSGDVMEFADVWLDCRRRKARRDGHWLNLSNKEFALLQLFMSKPTAQISKVEILEQVWPDKDPTDENLVEVYVNYLRTKLEIFDHPRLIHTVRGKGYVLQTDEG